MAIDHLVFNNQSWYSIAGNADNTTANGKKYYAVPSKITIKQGTSLTYPSRGSVDEDVSGYLTKDFEVKCIGANDNHYFFIGLIDDSPTVYNFREREGYGVGEVLKSDCKNIVW